MPTTCPASTRLEPLVTRNRITPDRLSVCSISPFSQLHAVDWRRVRGVLASDTVTLALALPSTIMSSKYIRASMLAQIPPRPFGEFDQQATQRDVEWWPSPFVASPYLQCLHVTSQKRTLPLILPRAAWSFLMFPAMTAKWAAVKLCSSAALISHPQG